MSTRRASSAPRGPARGVVVRRRGGSRGGRSPRAGLRSQPRVFRVEGRWSMSPRSATGGLLMSVGLTIFRGQALWRGHKAGGAHPQDRRDGRRGLCEAHHGAMLAKMVAQPPRRAPPRSSREGRTGTERRFDELADEAVQAIVTAIPGYAGASPAMRADIRQHVLEHYRAFVTVLETGEGPAPEDLSFIRKHAARRVEEVTAGGLRHGVHPQPGAVVACAARCAPPVGAPPSSPPWTPCSGTSRSPSATPRRCTWST